MSSSLVVRCFDPGPSLFKRSGRQPEQSYIRSSRFSDPTLIPLSQAVGSGGRVPSSLRLFRPSNPSVRPPGSTEVDRTSADSRKKLLFVAPPRQLAVAALFSTTPSITTPASTHFHSATSSLRASATTIFFLCALLAPLVRST